MTQTAEHQRLNQPAEERQATPYPTLHQGSCRHESVTAQQSTMQRAAAWGHTQLHHPPHIGSAESSSSSCLKKPWTQAWGTHTKHLTTPICCCAPSTPCRTHQHVCAQAQFLTGHPPDYSASALCTDLDVSNQSPNSRLRPMTGPFQAIPQHCLNHTQAGCCSVSNISQSASRVSHWQDGSSQHHQACTSTQGQSQWSHAGSTSILGALPAGIW